ncbi:TrkH family potassium uptake protein [Staphylococcus epidermidis]|uniref:TrkH family potassium uptake protein n=1 Tax=Staphylococcus epidermidis TaxID=1282 RepID=UPI001C3C9CCC|nr:TrkH family potassium uptake protein [Staphylococcus epidermidis]MBV5132296.1 TrkH family potassium uptake protein [Staphylococcus epidermidis]
MSVLSQLLKKSSPQQGIILYYLFAIVVAFLLLNLPYVHKQGVEVNPIDTLFVAVSGISVTGLSPITIVDTYSTFGQIIILIILNIGGIGVMAIGTMLWVVLGKHIGIRERQLIMLDNNRDTMSGTVKLILEIVRTIFIIEFIGALLLAFYFYRDNPDLKNALMQGIFVSVSATTNGGLDITGESLVPYAKDYFVQTIVMFLIVLGSIGFPVLLELKAYIKNRVTNFRFSLFTKITTTTYLFLFLFGVIVVLILEHSNAFKGLSWHQSLFYALFQSSTTRSAGLQTIDVSHFSDATNIVMGLLMFIGSSPSSVAVSYTHLTLPTNSEMSRGLGDVYKRQSLITFISMIIISATEQGKLSFLQIFFEVMSAFGTCGLSLGVTSDVNDITKVVLMILMFIGRVGLISFIIMLAGRKEPEKYSYPKERIQIG